MILMDNPTLYSHNNAPIRYFYVVRYYDDFRIQNYRFMHYSQQGHQRERQQRRSYRTVNAYSHKASKHQIATIALFLSVVVLHNIFITTSIGYIDSSILWVMLSTIYVLLIVIVYDYFVLTIGDPADDLLLGLKKEYSQKQIKHCNECKQTVHVSSYHCYTCKRCSQRFDHHCVYLNNCIGGKNYHNFFRLLSCVTLFCILIIGQGIWIFVHASNNQDFDSKIYSRWAVLITFIFTSVLMIVVDSLLCFHLYLIFYLKISTQKYLCRKEQQQILEMRQRNDSSQEQVHRETY